MKKWICLIGLIVLCSCESNEHVYEQYQELSEDIQWNKADSRTFKVNILDTTKQYNISIGFRYANGFQFRELRVQLIIKSVDWSGRQSEHLLKIVDENDEYIGEPAYDIWDSEHIAIEKMKFPAAGEYTFTIEHTMPVDPIDYAMEVGLIVDEIGK